MQRKHSVFKKMEAVGEEDRLIYKYTVNPSAMKATRFRLRRRTQSDSYELYKQIAKALKVTVQWPENPPLRTEEDRNTLRTLLYNAILSKYKGNLKALDNVVLSSGVIPPDRNKMRGNIFELWVRENVPGVSQEKRRPTFEVPAGDEIRTRFADGFRAEGRTLIEAKTIQEARRPSSGEIEQMVNYKSIIEKQITWIHFDENGTKTELTFERIHYLFNNERVANAWAVAIRENVREDYVIFVGSDKWKAE